MNRPAATLAVFFLLTPLIWEGFASGTEFKQIDKEVMRMTGVSIGTGRSFGKAGAGRIKRQAELLLQKSRLL